MLRAPALAAVLALAAAPCARRAAPDRPRAAADAAPPPAPRPATPAVPVACPWVWSEDTVLALPEAREFELVAACVDGALAAAWRADSVLGVAFRSLAVEAAWQVPPDLAVTDATALGEPLAADGALWIGWQGVGSWVRVARVDPQGARASGPAALGRTQLGAPQVLAAAGEQALVAATAHTHAGDQALLVPVGLTTTTAGAWMLGGEMVAATAGGAQPLVALVSRADGGAYTLQGLRFDGARALALEPAEGFEPLPDGLATRSAALALGRGRFEFAPAAASEGVLFESVPGEARGPAGVAWFPRGAGGTPATLVALPVAPATLGGVADTGDGQRVEATWWDDRHMLRMAAATPGGMAPARALALPTVRPVAASLGTRVVACGGARWVLQALRVDGGTRLYATRAGCLAR